ncbi:hypothetical protein ACOMHN_029844 [Nucella lapillus]
MNIIDEKLWGKLKKQNIKHKLRKCTKKLFPYTPDTPLQTVGCFDAETTAGGQSVQAQYVIVEGRGEPLLSRETAMKIGVLKIGLNVQKVTLANENADILKEFGSLFTGFGKLQDRQVEEKIQELVDKDFIEPVTSPWVSPIVIVPKPNNDVCICVDLRHVNEATMRKCHPIPNIDELLQDMAESRIFTKLDLKLDTIN